MPEELMIRCEDCGLVFNKITYPECPRCRHLRRKASDILPGAPVRAEERQAAQRSAALQDFLSGALPMVVAFLAGGASFMIGVNVSAGLAWNEAPVAVLKVPMPYVVWHVARSDVPANSTDQTPAAPPKTGEGLDAVVLDGLTKSVDDSNRVSFEGTLRNTANVAIDSTRISVSGYDATGTEIQSDWMLLAPARLDPGESGKFRLRILNHPSIEQFAFKASWNQPVEREVKTMPVVAPPAAQ